MFPGRLTDSVLRNFPHFVVFMFFSPSPPEPIDPEPAGGPRDAASCRSPERAGGRMDESSVSWGTQPEISQYALLKPGIRETTAWKLCKQPFFNLYFYLHHLKPRCSSRPPIAETLGHLFQIFSFYLSTAPAVITLIFHGFGKV